MKGVMTITKRPTSKEVVFLGHRFLALYQPQSSNKGREKFEELVKFDMAWGSNQDENPEEKWETRV